jgi:hypothetical protein
MKTLLLALLVAVQGFAYAGDDKPEIGRYQLLYAVTQESLGTNVVAVKRIWKIDTVTGQVWMFVPYRDQRRTQGSLPGS